jgi:hypothetical protein
LSGSSWALNADGTVGGEVRTVTLAAHDLPDEIKVTVGAGVGGYCRIVETFAAGGAA